MQLTSKTQELIKSAPNKALATDGKAGLNVVPVSMVVVDGDEVIVCDCFMNKTKQNIQAGSTAALAVWDGMKGVQIKGTIAYENMGDRFDRYVKWLGVEHPDRILRGVLVLKPTEEHDLAPKID